MTTTLSGVTTTEFREYTPAVDLTVRSAIPTSVFHGAFSVVFNGMPTPAQFVNGELHVGYGVRLQIAFEVSANDERVRYNAAVSDIGEIVRKRLDFQTFAGVFENIQHVQTSQMQFTGKTDNQSFGIISMDWLVTMQEHF